MIRSTLLALALALPPASPALSEEIARIPVARPCVVVVERDAASGVVRVIVEIPAGKVDQPGDDPVNPKPTPDLTIVQRFDAALIAIPADQRVELLTWLSSEIESAITHLTATPPGLRTLDDAIGYVGTRVVSRAVGDDAQSAVLRMVSLIRGVGSEGLSPADRLKAFQAIVDTRLGQLRALEASR